MNILEIIKENWLLLVIAIIGLGIINGKELFNIFKVSINSSKLEKTPNEENSNKSSVLPQIFHDIENLSSLLNENGFQKSSIEAKNLIKKIINEYSEIEK